MNRSVERVSHADHFQESILSPYRSSSAHVCRCRLASRLAPPGHESATSAFRAECLVLGEPHATVVTRVSFLHHVVRFLGDAPPAYETVERQIEVAEHPLEELETPLDIRFDYPSTLELDGAIERFQYAIEGAITLSAVRMAARLYRVSATLQNLTASDRDGLALRSLISADITLQFAGSELISITRPPEDHQYVAMAYHSETV